jgi:catechol 2,3-dioxygenase-like lactoylglutathione lyase family enzyme
MTVAPVSTSFVGEVHHVVMNVADLDRSLAFYTGPLGLRPTLTMDIAGAPFERLLKLPPGTTGRVAYVQGRTRVGQIELIEWTADQAVSGGAPFTALGPRMLSFVVAEGTLAEMQARLAAHGAVCWSEPVSLELPTYGTIEAFVAEDPDGNLIELLKLPSDEEVRSLRRSEGLR